MVELRLISAIENIQPDVEFILANQNSPIPQHTFCEVYTIGDKLGAMPTYENDEESESVSEVVLYRVSLSYNSLPTKDTHNYARYMSRFLQSFNGATALHEQGLSLIRINDVTKIPILKDADMYIKYVLDITLASEETDSFNIDIVDKAVIHGDLQIIEKDFEVNLNE